MSHRTLAAFAVFCAWAAPGHAAELCAWIVETNQPGNQRSFDLWFQSDVNVDFLYKVYGRDIATDTDGANVPSTYALHPGQAAKAWSSSLTLAALDKIDITVDIHKVPNDPFAIAPTPLLTSFAFRRDVPPAEAAPPPTLSNKQCAEIIEGE